MRVATLTGIVPGTIDFAAAFILFGARVQRLSKMSEREVSSDARYRNRTFHPPLRSFEESEAFFYFCISKYAGTRFARRALAERYGRDSVYMGLLERIIAERRKTVERPIDPREKCRRTIAERRRRKMVELAAEGLRPSQIAQFFYRLKSADVVKVLQGQP